MKKLSKIEKNINKYVDELNKLYPNYEFDFSNYNGSDSIISYICDKGHDREFKQIKKLLKGDGCGKCIEEAYMEEMKLKSIEVFNEVGIVHNFKYDYTDFIYFDNKTESVINCPIHGVFKMSMETHKKGHGCSKCSGNHNYSKEEYVDDVNIVHNFKYDYTNTVLTNFRNKIKVRCPKHDYVFELLPQSHKEGTGCPICYSENRKKKNKI